MSEHIVNIDERNAAALLIEESHQRPVVVDFWADWCGPCKTLMPLLEKLANEHAGAFLLAKVNADEQPMITQQFGVRSLPTVMVMQDGQPVDGFVGAQSEQQVRELLEKYLPKPWDGLLDQGQALMAQGDFSAALAPLRQAFEDSRQRHDITLAYAHALVECNRLDDADGVLATVKMADQDPAWEQLVAQVKLKREAAVTPEMAALEQQLELDPESHDVRHQLAVQYIDAGYYREALEHLITILRQDLNHAEGASKKTLLDTIASLGKGDPLAVEYQRKLYSLLY
ncbi:MAG: thioredoxin [Haliea sp.]|uniref:thioredoxin n=1 Tax=Haliea sp. TaxID=1932666 RepID=UPI0032EFF412